jgi:uroporphyrinogen decarboxylase
MEELKRHTFPNSRDPACVEGLAEEARRLYEETDKALLGAGAWGIYELSYCLRGIEELYIDMATNLPYVEALAERVLEWQIGYYDLLLDAVGPYIQAISVSDDLGHNDGPLFSPRIFRQVYKPRLRRLVELIKSKTEAKIYMHSCGSVYDYIPDFIEIGVDALNPVQVSARDMDTARLKKEFGPDLAFWGGGSDNNILSFGTPQQVEEEVKKRIYDLAPGGGYVFCSIHNISAEVPPKNIVAFYEAALKHGIYP